MLNVVAGIIESKDGILLCQRHHDSRRFPLKWEFPGGKVELGETPEEAIIRELQEELSITVTKTQLIVDYAFAYPNEDAIHLHFFKILNFKNDIKDLQFENITWVQKEKLSEYDILKGDIPFLSQYLSNN